MAAFQLKPGQGVAVIGLRGKGKTRIIWALLAGLRSWVAMDGKHDPAEWAAFARKIGAVLAPGRQPGAILRAARVVYQVEQFALDDRAGWKKAGTAGYFWTQANAYVWQRQNTWTVYDDALEQLPSTGANPHARRNVTQGRSVGIGTMIGAQTANWLDTRMLKQLEHFILLPQGQRDEDLELVARHRNADPRPLAADLPDFHFLYQPEVGQPWVECAPVPDMLPRRRA